MKDLVGLLVIVALLPLLVWGVRAAAVRFELSGEVKRKLVHVGMGLVSLSFPWVFSSWHWVAVLCVLSLVILRAVRYWERRAGRESVLHDIKRKSLGEIFFPLAVVIVFALAGGEPAHYVIPILVLTLADAAGALIGVNYGRQRFHVLSGWKTAEGSLLVFFVAFLSVHVPLLLMTDTGRPETLLIALTLALLAMLIEAVSDFGLDNLVLPVTVAWLLAQYADRTAEELILRCVVILSLLVVVLLGKRYSSLEGGALLGAVLLGYACFFFGDWRFLIPPLILFGEHLWVSRRVTRIRDLERVDLWVIVALAVSFLPWIVWAARGGEAVTAGLRGLVMVSAIHLAILNYTTRSFISRKPGSPTARRQSGGKAIYMVLLPGFLLSGLDRGMLVQFAVGCAFVFAGLHLFRWISGRPGVYPSSPIRWARQATAATLASVPVWAVQFLLPA